MLVMAINSQNPLWYVLGMLVVGCGLYSFLWYINKYRKGKKKPPVPPVIIQDSIIGPPEPPIEAPEEIIVQIKPIIKFFGGFMNSLLGVIRDYDAENANVTFKNFKQVINAHGSEKLKKWYYELENDRNTLDEAFYKSKATELLNILKKCGVNRSFEIKGEWNTIAEQHFRKIGPMEYGQLYEVLEPCWIFENEVLEKGLVRRIN